jgi:putative heme-binding domain-containing protein
MCVALGSAGRAWAADEDDPAAEQASFQVADGFEVHLFASEKDGVVKPIQIRFDARGRLWVIGSTVYPQIQPGETPDDKILILEDRDGDGRCDKTTVFARGLMIPTGLELGDGGAYIGHGTELLFLKDTDGDDQADERRVLLRGFGTGDNHQNINSFRWGLGGELWMCQGLHIHSNVETPWGLVRLHQAGLWRLRPRLMKLEGFYGSEHEPQNPWGYVFTDWGEPIVIAGNNSSAIYPVPGLVVNHRDDAPPLIWKNGQGRKSSGGEIVGTTHFPPEWQGMLIIGGYINNAVWALKISDDGAGFSLEDRPPLIRSTSRNFRPVDAKFGPDGALYLCDWFNPIIGHYQASFRHPDRDKSHGRIWRVTAQGRPLTKAPQLVGAGMDQLLEHLRSADRWTRQFARRALADRPTAEVTAALDRWTSTSGLSEQTLVETLGVYRSHEVVASNLLARLCHAQASGARAYAASTVGAWADRLSDPLSLLRPLATDEHPRVRLQTIIACAAIPSAEALEVASRAMDLPADKFIEYGFRQTVFALKSSWLPALRAGRLQLENGTSRLAALIRADGTPDTLQALREVVALSSAPPDRRQPFLVLLAEVGDAADLTRLLDPRTFTSGAAYEAARQAEALNAMRQAAQGRKIRPDGDVATALNHLWQESPNEELRLAAVRLAAQWKVPAPSGSALVEAIRNSANEELRAAAALALGAVATEANARLLQDLAAPDRPLTERAAAAAGYTLSDLPKAARLAAEVLAADTSGTHALILMRSFLERQRGSAALAASLKTTPPSRDAARVALRTLSASGKQDPELSATLVQAAKLGGEPLRPTGPDVQELVRQVRDQGDAARGAEVFRRSELGCANCHRLQGQGGVIGPDLSALGTAQPIDFIIGAILDPQKEIKEGFSSVVVLTRDGEEYQGYPVRESGEELVLRDVLRDREVHVRKADIQERRAAGSVMPSGLADALTRAEFRDLVRFLSEQGQPR